MSSRGTDLSKLSSRRVYRLQQGGVAEADGVGPDAYGWTVLFVQSSLGFHVRPSPVVDQSPEVGVLGQERARDVTESR